MDEEALFHLAAEKPVDERGPFLEQACGGNAALRQRVELLLESHESPAEFLEPLAGGLHPDLTLVPPVSMASAGTVIGRYRLLEPIGEGGYGTVFMAEQTSPVQRKVALKIIKAGMDTRQVIARFEAERQALALMDHPNIAKVFDAGMTDTGRPYFVMELVKGVPITKYSDQSHLPPRARLELFMQVCQAVQHAHTKGVIHRDIKPSNVLVALYDGKAVPKVIDFGVAKATGQKLTERTMFTGFGDVIGTLEYMSPEQAEVNQLDVDARSDIYSLGVMLYELLTGSTPLEGGRARKAALLEMLRVVREEEPPRPSMRLSGSDKLPSIAASRGLEPAKLSALVHGELDWIVMKALEKDRNRRYETANGFARDVERYLHDEAVQACPPSARYRFRKFARRNKAPLVTAAMIAVALVLGTVISTWQALRARTAEALAQTRLLAEAQARASAVAEAGKAKAISDLLQEMLESARPNPKAGPEYTVRQLLDNVSAGLGEKLKDQPEAELAVRITILNAYRALALPKQAKPHAQGALDLRRQLYGPDHVLVGDSLLDYAWIVRLDGNAPEAERYAREAVAVYRKQNAETKRVLNAFSALQHFLISQSMYVEAEAVGQEALTVARREGQEKQLVGILQSLSTIKRVTGFPVEAEKLSSEALVLQRTTYQLLEHATNLSVQGKVAEAEPLLREALDLLRRNHFDESHPTMVDVKVRLADVLRDKGDNAGMKAVLTPLLVEFEKSITQSPDNLVARMRRANAVRDLRDYDGAIAEYSQVLSRKPDHPAREYRDRVYLLRGNFPEAEQYFSDEIRRDPNRADAWSGRAFSHFHRQQWAPAIADFSKAIELNPQVHSNPFHRGHAYMNLGEWDKAAADFRKATDMAPNHTDSWYQRAVVHAQLREPADACTYLRRAVAQDSRYGEWMKTEQRLEPIRANDEFKKLLAEAEEKRK